MARIERSRASVSDYEEIWRYIARDNPPRCCNALGLAISSRIKRIHEDLNQADIVARIDD
jgi:plasmid stabilization system protein ParE